jgi:hypothetical protein
MSEKMTFYIPGTLAANQVIEVAADRNWKLLHVSAVASNDSDATLIIGNDGDTDAYLESSTIGDSDVPEEFSRDDFVNGEFPTHEKGDVFVITLDYDGDGGTAAQNVVLVLTIDSY